MLFEVVQVGQYAARNAVGCRRVIVVPVSQTQHDQPEPVRLERVFGSLVVRVLHARPFGDEYWRSFRLRSANSLPDDQFTPVPKKIVMASL
jgi:hypothetical protein